MQWLHRLRVRLFPVTYAAARQHVDTLDQALADLRATVASLPAHERAARAPDVQALMSEHAHARNVLSNTLDDRSER